MTDLAASDLPTIYPAPSPRVIAKARPEIDAHAKKFIAMSPFCVLATSGSDGSVDASPRGGNPGFVHVLSPTQLAMPDRCVVANTGDGGFLMNGHEIEVAVRYKANIIIVVYNNRLLSGGGYLDRFEYSDITDVDFASYARAFGAQGITVRRSSELAEAFRTARKSNTVTLIDVKTDRAISSPSIRQ